MEIKDCSAIITGGGTGMGGAVADVLSQQGVKLALLGRRLEVVEKKARQIGAIGISCDISDYDSVQSAMDRVTAEIGTARILIHAAASGHIFPLLKSNGESYPIEKLKEIIDINVLGTLYVNQAFATRLSKLEPLSNNQRGLIINVSSIGADDGVVGSSYAMSKAAVNGLCLSLARELSPWGIRVVTIAPGAIDTDMFRDGANDSTYAAIALSIPGVARIGNPDEFAKLVKHICENDYLNATIIRLDGGMRIPFIRNIGKDADA